ncbi:MAG TPA: hypothetical protein VJW23_02500, partial [Propionibacteriaceae bacterium]|nr:hypothetical protein [Propionibacteriaceae bacterium]
TGRAHLWGVAAEKERSILDCINDSDAMVSDVSSVVSDYLFSSKPFAMIAVPAAPDDFVVEYPVARGSYVVRADLADLDGQLENMLGPDPLAGQRADIRADYLGDFPPDNYAAAFVDAVRHVSRKSMEDIEDDQSEDAGAEQGGKEDEDRRSGDDDGAALPGRSWSKYAQIVARVGLDLAGTAIAVLVLAMALAGGPIWLTTVLAVLAVWAAFQSVSSSVVAPERWSRLLTEGDATRAVLVVALAVTARNAGQLSWHLAAACALLLMMIVVERRIRAAWGTGLVGENLPGALREISDLIPRGLLPILNGLVIIIAFALILVGAPPLILLILVGAIFIAAAEVTVRAVRLENENERAELRLRPALEAYRPEFVVYFASTVGANYQLGMWLPYFVRIGRPFVIVTRTAPMLAQISELC